MQFVADSYAGSGFYRCASRGRERGTGGTLYRYTLWIERGLRVDRAGVAHRIAATLADPRGWTRSGTVRFQRIASGADTDVLLATPATVDKLCAPLATEGEVSCCNGRRVVLNVVRWREAVPHWTDTLTAYRQMVVNHEFGHRIGKGHGSCPGAGALAPVMQQQTYDLRGCRANSWPLDGELLH